MARLKGLLSTGNLIFIILMGIFSLLVDGPRLKRDSKTKELGILRGVSYFYILGGIIMLVVLKRFRR